MVQQNVSAQKWLPIILQSIVILLAAFSYTSAMDRRIALAESKLGVQEVTINRIISLLDKHEERMRLLENNQERILALEDYAYRRTR